MQELLDTLDGWRAEGAGVGRAVVVRTFGSAPRPEGAVLLVTDDGRLAGSVSGGCVEGAAAEEIWAARKSGRERVIRYGISDEQAWDVGLACGGTIDVLISPARARTSPSTAARETREGRGDGRAIVTPLPADAPPAVVRRAPARGGRGARRRRWWSTRTAELEGTLGDAAADAAARRRGTRRPRARRLADDRGRPAASCSSRRTRSGRGWSSSAPSRSRARWSGWRRSWATRPWSSTAGRRSRPRRGSRTSTGSSSAGRTSSPTRSASDRPTRSRCSPTT